MLDSISQQWQRKHIRHAVFGSLLILGLGSMLVQYAEIDSIPTWTPWADTGLSTSVLDTTRNGLPYTKQCGVKDFVHGTWQNRTMMTSPEQVIDAYGFESWVERSCWPIRTRDQQDKDFDTAAQLDQAFFVATPEYVPRNGCILPNPDTRRMIIHLLRSPAGMIMAGDSISGYWELSLRNYFMGSNSPVLARDDCHERALYLDKNHPSIPDLLEAAGVSSERLETPLYTWFRTVHLLNGAELQATFPDPSKFNLKVNACGWQDWFDRATAVIQAGYAADVKYSKGVVPESTILLVDTGPHWDRSKLGENMTEDEIFQGFINTVMVFEKKVRNVPWDMKTYWRATSPGHVGCGDPPITYDNTRTTIQHPDEPTKSLFQWHMFPRMNDVIRAVTVDDRPVVSKFSSWFTQWGETPIRTSIMSKTLDDQPNAISDELLSGIKPSTGARNPPIRLLDIWYATIKRPDSHLRPRIDCLHFCVTGVKDIWTKAVAMEARNG